MNLKHRMKVRICDEQDTAETILTSGESRLRSRMVNRLLGGKIGVLLLVPEGKTVRSVEICEEKGCVGYE